ncbi:MAG: aldehyde dehydrogenase family protein [Croceibacterium sp.]
MTLIAAAWRTCVPQGREADFRSKAQGSRVREEIFGPVAPIMRFSDEDDVVARANDTEHGLAAYLYTRDMQRGLQMGERLEFGMIGLNRGMMSDPAAPFGGVKQSGLGREGAHDGLMEFLETQYFSAEW